MEKDPGKKGDQNQGDQANNSSLVQKIQQLGQSNVPQAPDSNIHVLSIIGQVEGHVQLPAQINDQIRAFATPAYSYRTKPEN